MSGPQSPTGAAKPHALPAQLLHDLRTPLSQIVGYSELLAERAEAAGDDGCVADLHKIGAAGYRILALIEENFHPVPAPGPARAASANGRGPVPARQPTEAAPAGRVPLADFIAANREPILAEWEAFARTCKPASSGWTSWRCATMPTRCSP